MTLVVAAIGAALLLASCGGSGQAEGSQPTVLDTDQPLPADERSQAGENESTADDTSEAENGEAEDDDGGVDGESEPIPASSEGPAQNWPEPEVPEEIYEPTEEGAEALIQYWFDARHHARVTGEVEVLEQVSMDECELCRAEIEAIEEVYPAGWFLEESSDEIEESYVRKEADSIVSGLFELQMQDFETFVDGEPYSETEGNRDAVFGLDFRFVDGLWQAFEFTPLGEAESIEDAEM